MKHAYTTTIETPRLILRRFEVGDAEDMFCNWASDNEVTRYLSWAPHVDTEESARILQRWVCEYENPDNYHWGIVPKDMGCVTGSIGVVNSSENNLRCEIGYCISRALWGRGMMTEALMAVIWFLFENTGFNRIEAKHDTRNIASGRVMQKAGMTHEGTLRQYICKADGCPDMSVYSFLRCEYNRTGR